MITISRSIIRQFRAVIKRAGIHKSRAALSAAIVFSAGEGGLRIRAQSHDVAICCDLPGSFPAEQLVLPQQLLDDCEGRKDEPATLEAQSDGRIVAQWREGGIPQRVQYDAWKKNLPEWPAAPESFSANEPGFLEALAGASETTDRQASRFALGCIQFRGDQGSLVATDGRQLLIQSGYQFPWQEDVLATGAKIFGSPELPRDLPVGVGKTDKHVVLTVGQWTIWLAIEAELRFPKVDDLVRNPDAAANRCRLSAADAQFLARSLAHLPCHDETYRPVTVDLNGHIAVRGKSQGQALPTEIMLSTSAQEGEPRRFNMNREYLARAIGLGLRDLCFFGDDKIIQARGERRLYLWMPLTAKDAIPPSPDAVRIESPTADAAAATTFSAKSRKPTVTNQPSPSAAGPIDAPHLKSYVEPEREALGDDAPSSIEQAKQLRGGLREMLAQTNRLIASLRRQQKQSKAVASTLASLKQLQRIGA